ncbi:MAG: phosphatidate cytidylyltransferase [Candidatus Saccharicenans sp.]|uniref:phosphatidate cytidylyltransferase n=1 Tax=Candidatus Saccharicenans sp. TaxID=2819258 RepID=UPI004049B0F9
MGLWQRTKTAVIILGILFVIIQFAPVWVFFLALQLTIIGGLLEFYSLAERRKFYPKKLLGCIFALMIGATFYFDQFPFLLGFTLMTLITFVYFVIDTSSLEKLALFPGSFSLTMAGLVYISLTMNFLYWVRRDFGALWLYLLFTVIALGDTGAFLVGKTFGRHKMTPIASPNKTWEGAVGGLIWAAAGGWLARTVLLPKFPLLEVIILSIVVHAAAQVADPLESLFKRAAGVKDSSNLVPGHGGIMDRIDSFTLAAPVFYYLMKLLIIK